MTQPGYPELIDEWENNQCYQTPSALHGWLTGYMATGARLTDDQWLREAVEYLEIETLEPTLEKLILSMKESMLNELTADAMSYTPLLPDDDEADVDDQVDSLAQWSKGFLDGIGASGRIKGRPNGELLEVLQDLDAFSQAAVEDVNDPENTQLFLQLVEHARISALTVFYLFNKPNNTNKSELH